MSASRWAVAGLAMACLLGCDQRFFSARGSVASSGGRLGNWHSTPEGCSRDPFDGKPAADSASVATFLWEDPSVHDPDRDKNRYKAPDAPMRLEISRLPGGLRASLTTVKIVGMRIDSSDCSQFRLEQRDEAPGVAGAKPALAGRLVMQCTVAGGQVSADVRFDHCEY